MLDVCIVGVLLSCLAAGVYERQGVSFVVLPGIYTLAFAEIIHYSLYYALSCIIDANVETTTHIDKIPP